MLNHETSQIQKQNPVPISIGHFNHSNWNNRRVWYFSGFGGVMSIDIEELKRILERSLNYCAKGACEYDNRYYAIKALNQLKAENERLRAENEKLKEKVYWAIDSIARYRLNPDSAIDYIEMAEMKLKGQSCV